MFSSAQTKLEQLLGIVLDLTARASELTWPTPDSELPIPEGIQVEIFALEKVRVHVLRHGKGPQRPAHEMQGLLSQPLEPS